MKKRTAIIIAGAFSFLLMFLIPFLSIERDSGQFYTVIAKESGSKEYSESVGKYSVTKVKHGTWIAIRYEDGSDEYLHILNPFIADTYAIGHRYFDEGDPAGMVAFLSILASALFGSISWMLLYLLIEWIDDCYPDLFLRERWP